MLLAALSGALVYEAKHTGITADEPSHLLSAGLYWRGADTLKPRDMPPLIKIVGGWPSRLLPWPDLTADGAGWATQHEWVISQSVLRRMPFEVLDRWVFYSRLALIVFPLLTTILIWKWGRELFSPGIGLILAALFACEPTALGHGALFKNDHAATFGLLVFAYAAWRYWRAPGAKAAAWLGVATLLAVLAKLSLLILPPVAMLLAARRPRHLLLISAVMYLGAIAACQFDARRISPAELAVLERDSQISRVFVAAAHIGAIVPIPQLLWQGVIAIAKSNATDNAIWLLGQVHNDGHPAYFALALLLKTPLALQALFATSLAAAIVWRRPSRDVWFLVAPAGAYFLIASFSALQFGVRLVLPCLPFALLFCGFLLQQVRREWALAALLFAAGSSARAFPLGLSYFHEGIADRHRVLHYLSDSNVDWGQDLPRLASFVQREQVQQISVAYFGNDNISRWLPQHVEMIPVPWSRDWAGPEHFIPKPGLYAVSGSLITGHFFLRRYREYFAYFRDHQPVAIVGGSIFIYLVDYRPEAVNSAP